MRAMEILLVGMTIGFLFGMLLDLFIPQYAGTIDGVLSVVCFVLAGHFLQKSIAVHPSRLGPPIDEIKKSSKFRSN